MKELALFSRPPNERAPSYFDLPEPVIDSTNRQRMTKHHAQRAHIAHRLIEEFMLAANRAVAAYLLRRGI